MKVKDLKQIVNNLDDNLNEYEVIFWIGNQELKIEWFSEVRDTEEIDFELCFVENRVSIN